MAVVAALYTMHDSLGTKFDFTAANDDKTKITSLSGYPQLRTA